MPDTTITQVNPGIPDAGEPLRPFQDWMAEAERSEPNDPNAMTLATVHAGRAARRRGWCC